MSKTKETELVIPHRGNVAQAKRFLLQKQSWLFEKLDSIKESPKTKGLKQVIIFGTAHKVQHVASESIFSASIENGTIRVVCPTSCLKEAVLAFLKDFFLKESTELANSIARKHGFYFKKISIRDASTRWGSCSAAKSLSFNWRLVFAPTDVVRYVIVHELCHLKQMNHSKKFWSLVEKVEPKYSSARLWLKQNEVVLHSYLR